MGVERIWALSDVHTDKATNMRWIKGLEGSESCYSNDTLILAGDISDNLDIVQATLMRLKQTFRHVFFCPGNHDLWVRKSRDMRSSSGPSISSLDALERLLQLCVDVGVQTRPGFAAGCVIAPILSWHHKSWDTEPEVTCWDGIAPADQSIMDYVFCDWPRPLDAYCNDDSIAQHFDKLNDQLVRVQARSFRVAHSHQSSAVAGAVMYCSLTCRPNLPPR